MDENDKPKEETNKDSEKPKENLKPPEANFAQLVLLLGAGAMQQLGLVPNPVNGKTQVDLQVAKFSIDLLGVLQEKTKGNLSDKENKMLDDLLFDLRMRYVNATREKDTK